MDITIGLLTWGSPLTLANTLSGWELHGLHTAREKIMWAQEGNGYDQGLAKLFGYDIVLSRTNVGIAKAYKGLVELASNPYFLFLENDWDLTKDAKPHIFYAKHILESRMADVVRLRDRHNPGQPLWTRQFEGRELDRPTHLLDCVHWLENPDEKYPELIYKDSRGFYYAQSKNANWTNNPTMFRTDDLKIFLEHFGDGNVEQDMQGWWEQQEFVVAQGEGLFTHNRLDR